VPSKSENGLKPCPDTKANTDSQLRAKPAQVCLSERARIGFQVQGRGLIQSKFKLPRPSKIGLDGAPGSAGQGDRVEIEQDGRTGLPDSPRLLGALEAAIKKDSRWRVLPGTAFHFQGDRRGGRMQGESGWGRNFGTGLSQLRGAVDKSCRGVGRRHAFLRTVNTKLQIGVAHRKWCIVNL
jgi:hypothetical protein